MIAIIVLHGLLSNIGCQVVFLDDLLRKRLHQITNLEYDNLVEELKKLGYSEFLTKRESNYNFVIWGAGTLAKDIISKSNFINNNNLIYLVDNDPNKWKTKLSNYEIYNPEKLLEDNFYVIVSASQNTPYILEEFNKLGLNKNRLIRSLVI